MLSPHATLTPIMHMVSDGICMINSQPTRPFSFYVYTCSCTQHMAERCCKHSPFTSLYTRSDILIQSTSLQVQPLQACRTDTYLTRDLWICWPRAGLFLSLHSLEIWKNKKVAIISEAPPAQTFSLPLPSVRTDLVWQRLSSLTFSTHIGLISSQNCNSNPGREAVRSRAPSLWSLLHNTWNPIKAMKSNQRRLHLVMLIFHLLAIKSNSSPKLFIYLFPSRACSVALYIYPPLLAPQPPPPRTSLWKVIWQSYEFVFFIS